MTTIETGYRRIVSEKWANDPKQYHNDLFLYKNEKKSIICDKLSLFWIKKQRIDS